MILIHILKFLYLEIKIQLNDIVNYLSTDKIILIQTILNLKLLKNLKKIIIKTKKLNSKNGF